MVPKLGGGTSIRTTLRKKEKTDEQSQQQQQRMKGNKVIDKWMETGNINNANKNIKTIKKNTFSLQ